MESYELHLSLDEQSAKILLDSGGVTIVNPPEQAEPLTITFTTDEFNKHGAGLNVPIKDGLKLVKALTIPTRNFPSVRKAWQTYWVYWFLSPSRMSSFFVRGWRLAVIRKMLDSSVTEGGLAPDINRLRQIGNHIREGIRLVGAKLVYDLPKILILTAVGYHYIEFILDWMTYFLSTTFGTSEEGLDQMISETKFKVTRVLFFQIFFVMLYSLVVTPAFKITEIKYAAGLIPYKGFFQIDVLKESFLQYRKYRISTVQIYLWDKLITLTSWIIGLLLLLTLPFLYFVFFPLYKLFLKHWPKAYGYGVLARKMQANQEFTPLKDKKTA